MLFYANVEINLHICNTPPFLPPSLKGKGTSTQALCSTYLLFKSAPLRKQVTSGFKSKDLSTGIAISPD